MKTVPFSITKMSGAGNDFLLVDLMTPEDRDRWEALFGHHSRMDWAARLCDRRFGLGADGLVFLAPSAPPFSFAWDFYNSDGSVAEMCGNAARCAAKFAHDKGFATKSFSFLTARGAITAEILEEFVVRVEMPSVTKTLWNLPLSQGYLAAHYCFVDTGVPHAVVEIPPSLRHQAETKAFAQSLRTLKEHGPGGANVTLVEMLGPEKVRATTFERGVEDFTLACGTGAVAAAVWLQHQQPKVETVDVSMPGGLLKVHLSGPRPLLTGPVTNIATMQPFESLIRD